MPPLEPRFEELKGYPRHIQNLPLTSYGIEDEAELEIERGKDDVAQALMLGRLQAEGRHGIEEPGTVPDADSDEEIVDDEYRSFVHDDYHSFVHDDTHSQIPSSFWQSSSINWDRSSIRPKRWHGKGSDVGEYLDVRIRTLDLLRVFPDPRAKTVKPAGTRGRLGHPVVYDQQQFWLMCVLEVAAHGWPTFKAEFHRRMDLAWRVVFGEPVPERGWFSDRYDELEKLRPTYERGRKMLDDG